MPNCLHFNLKVVDEQSLKKHVAATNSLNISSDQKNMQMLVNGSNSRQKVLTTISGVNESMDNVNLSDTEAGQSGNSTQTHQIRGKQFCK